MALSDPQAVTIGTTPGALTLPRTSTGANQSIYNDNNGTAYLRVSSSYAKRTRRTVRIDYNKIAPDPITAVNQKMSSSVYVVIDSPPSGFTVAELKDLTKSLADWLNASSNANLIKVLGGES